MPVTRRMEMGAGDAHDHSLQPDQCLKSITSSPVMTERPSITVEIVDVAEKQESGGSLSPCMEHADSQPVLDPSPTHETSPACDSHAIDNGLAPLEFSPQGGRSVMTEMTVPTTLPPAVMPEPLPVLQSLQGQGDGKENEAPPDDQNSLMCYLTSQQAQNITLSGPDGQLVTLPKGVNIHVEARVGKAAATTNSSQQVLPQPVTAAMQQPVISQPQQPHEPVISPPHQPVVAQSQPAVIAQPVQPQAVIAQSMPQSQAVIAQSMPQSQAVIAQSMPQSQAVIAQSMPQSQGIIAQQQSPAVITQPIQQAVIAQPQQAVIAQPVQPQQAGYFNRPSPDGQFVLPGPTVGPNGQIIHNINAELKGTPHPRTGLAYPGRGPVYLTNNLSPATSTPMGGHYSGGLQPTRGGLHPTPLGQHAQPQVVLSPPTNNQLLQAQFGYKMSGNMSTPAQMSHMRLPYNMRTPVHQLSLNSSGSDRADSSPDYPVPPRPPYNTPEDSFCQHLSPQALPLGPLSGLNEDSPYNEYDIGKHQHNAKERFRRSRIKKACDVMRSTVPGMTCKTDKATVFEFGAQYILFLKSLIGQEHDKEFLRRYSPY